MKFDSYPSAPDEVVPHSPVSPEPPPADEPEQGGVKARYRPAVDDALSCLERLRAHAWEHARRTEELTREWPAEGVETEGLFRLDRFSGRTGGVR
ncbi:hypothetical protein ABZ644_21970 [Nocardiopsis alba]|uniref:hypothetical protein n=1 Tax=Nocardiopsis alba TaxID=53437 RepID=UPI003405BDF6